MKNGTPDHFQSILGPCINAAVRGRLYSNETASEVPVFDGTVELWSSWRLEVSEVVTSGGFSGEDSKP